MDRYDRGRWRGQWRRDWPRSSGGLLGGIILAGIGVLLLLQNLGIPYFDDLERYWPVILIVVGVVQASRSMGMGGRIWGGIVFAVGVVFLLQNFNVIHGDVWRFLWPAVLIMVGLGMLAKAIDRGTIGGPAPGTAADAARNLGEKIRNDVHDRIMSDIGGTRNFSSAADSVSEWAVFGGTRRRVTSQNFQGGEAFAMFGGVVIDLRNAGAVGEVYIEANSIFGGVEIRVPETWTVVVKGVGIFGGYEDKTLDSRIGPDSKQTQLIVNGVAVFGGVTVRY
jgi:predicted membrane protein